MNISHWCKAAQLAYISVIRLNAVMAQLWLRRWNLWALLSHRVKMMDTHFTWENIISRKRNYNSGLIGWRMLSNKERVAAYAKRMKEKEMSFMKIQWTEAQFESTSQRLLCGRQVPCTRGVVDWESELIIAREAQKAPSFCSRHIRAAGGRMGEEY